MKKLKIDRNESSEFYRLVLKATKNLVPARGAEIEDAVANSLSRLAEYFGVGNVALGGISKSGDLIPELYLWGGLPTRNVSLAIDPQPGPNMAARFASEGSIVYSCLEDLDDLPQFREHTAKMGVPAAVFWAHRDTGPYVEGMAISSPVPRKWPANAVEHLGAVGEVIFNALHRRQAEIVVERLRKVDTAVAEVAANFVDIRPDLVDEETLKALGRICEAGEADMAGLFRWEGPDQSKLIVSHEWDGGAFDAPYFRDVDLSATYPWLAARLKDSSPLIISNLEDFPPEAAAARAESERIGVQSVLWAPFKSAHGQQGCIALCTVDRPGDWLSDLVPKLGLLGNILGRAFDHKKADLQLRRANAEIRTLKERLEVENLALKEEAWASGNSFEIIGKSHAFCAIIHQAEQVAPTDSTVLLLGETGTGKGLMAHKIHNMSLRRDKLLVTVNCAALPSTLIESELFGHERGAFTGAVSRKVGRFELADGGTIFLDEIGDLPLELQTKLLRVLQDKQFERLGSSNTITVDARIIAATNRNLDTLIEQGAFRSDLYYRLGVFPIHMPPLRERRGDIPLFVWYFITDLQARLGKRIDEVPASVMEEMVEYEWPGNVRELQNVVERAMILSPDNCLKLDGLSNNRRVRKSSPARAINNAAASLEDVERGHIVMTLEDCDWKVRGEGGAAERLGLKRSTLQSRMKKLGIRRPT
jgi:formate hydrogenlyase transcriptional activator